MTYKKDDSFYKMSIQYVHRIETAQRLLSKQIKKDFPIGTKLIVKLSDLQIKSEVTNNDTSWWVTPDRFAVKNIKTGKARRVTLRDVICRCDDDWNQITD